MQNAVAVGLGVGFTGNRVIMDGPPDRTLIALPEVPAYGTGSGAKGSARHTGKEAMAASGREALVIEHLPYEKLAYLAGAQARRKQHLANAIEELPEKERTVFALYYFEKLTVREVAVTLGVVESGVSEIYSSMLRLRSALTDLRTKGLPKPGYAVERDGGANFPKA